MEKLTISCCVLDFAKVSGCLNRVRQPETRLRTCIHYFHRQIL
ncbi:hypothetical protein [Kingella sp. (in: b-proteobacteria)]|nr:hypothetical protein [Kingella sp. (in: b-proteobacteria)]MDO4656998.1 hypothetical protein [Kingella sp. (in: b-proteobacteria)]